MPVYEFSYKGEAGRHIGIMADDVAIQFPTAAEYGGDGKILSYSDKEMISILRLELERQDKLIRQLEKAVSALERRGK